MKIKIFLYIGLLLLATGIALKKTTNFNVIPVIFMVIGVVLKLIYFVFIIRRGQYKPGFEIGILLLGLILFFSGIYLKSINSLFSPAYLIVPGISLKVIFVILILRKKKLKQT